MPHKTNPTHAGGVVGLGVVKAVAADDFLRNTASPSNAQQLAAKFVILDAGQLVALAASAAAARALLLRGLA
jgi:hypothetical protein